MLFHDVSRPTGERVGACGHCTKIAFKRLHSTSPIPLGVNLHY